MERDLLENLGVYGKIIFKQMLEKCSDKMEVWTGLICPTIEPSGCKNAEYILRSGEIVSYSRTCFHAVS
jgi:hypothetical protein